MRSAAPPAPWARPGSRPGGRAWDRTPPRGYASRPQPPRVPARRARPAPRPTRRSLDVRRDRVGPAHAIVEQVTTAVGDAPVAHRHPERLRDVGAHPASWEVGEPAQPQRTGDARRQRGEPRAGEGDERTDRQSPGDPCDASSIRRSCVPGSSGGAPVCRPDARLVRLLTADAIGRRPCGTAGHG